MRVLGVLLLFFIYAVRTSAQESTISHFVSDDHAVEFRYPLTWTIEKQATVFNQVYHYELWTHSYAAATFFGNHDRSYIALDIIHPNEAGYPEHLISPLDYARYALTEGILESSTLTIGANPAIRVIPAEPAMPISQPLEMQQGDGPAIIVTPIGGQGVHEGVFYSVVRDDGWVVWANLAAPPDEIQAQEQVVLDLLNSLEFDAQAAAIPFESRLEIYDVSSINLPETFTSSDSILSLRYPSDWSFENYDILAEPPAMFTLLFAVPDADTQVRIMVLDVTNEAMGFALDQNDPQEYMRQQRHLEEGEVTEFRIGSLDAVSVITRRENAVEQSISIPLNDQWIGIAFIQANLVEQLENYEAEAVAVLNTLQFALGESFIHSPVLQVTLPDEWVLGLTEQADESYYYFLLRPHGNRDPHGPRITIELVNLQGSYLLDVLNSQGEAGALEALLLSLELEFEGEPQSFKIGGHTVARMETIHEEMQVYGEFNALRINQTWLFMITGLRGSMDDAGTTTPAIEQIIEGMVVTPPSQ